ncbi:hypothetical protein PO909_000084 [Leuciscus waleckii]
MENNKDLLLMFFCMFFMVEESVICVLCSVSVSPSSSSSSSSSQTEISPGRSVTLSCWLYSYAAYSCDYLVSWGYELLWVNQAGVDLKTDSRYQILSSSDPDQDRCIIISLTTTLLNEDDNREWRCQLTLRNQLETSVRYTVKYSDTADTASETEVSVTAGSLYRGRKDSKHPEEIEMPTILE